MDIQTFIDNYQETFSGKAELPIAFWYSDTLSGKLRKTQGCLFKALPAIRNGEIISMSGESIGCGGGKFYTGFTPMPEHVPNFVSLKERYKQTPEMVLEGIKKIDVQRATKQYIHFARIDRLTPSRMWKGFCSSLPRISCPAWSRGRFSTITRPRPSPRLLARDVAQPLRKPSMRTGVAGTVLSLASSIPRPALMWKATY